MGMMSWTYITICFAYKQYELYGSVSNSMIVSVLISGAFPSIDHSLADVAQTLDHFGFTGTPRTSLVEATLVQSVNACYSVIR